MNVDDVAELPAPRILNLIQSFWLDEYSKYWYPGVEEDVRGSTREQIDVIMYRRKKPDGHSTASSTPYLEADENGFFPGLERAGRLDA